MHGALRTIVLGIGALASLAFVTGMTGTSKPASEAAYWHELSRLNATDKPRALAFALQGDAWFSGAGPQAEARKAMVVTLLVDLGRMNDARARTRAFMTAFPNSEYLPIVQGVTGIHPRPHGPQSHP